MNGSGEKQEEKHINVQQKKHKTIEKSTGKTAQEHIHALGML